MGCSLKKEKQFSTINIHQQTSYYFTITNRSQKLEKINKTCRFTNSIPILSSINYSTIILRRNKLMESQNHKKVYKMINIETSTKEQQKK